jgi:hypothetical protein
MMAGQFIGVPAVECLLARKIMILRAQLIEVARCSNAAARQAVTIMVKL